ncbi:MAG: hypothetical protein S4CHLAM81_02010 [Chlamydiales bacterium]|nr:hypothetical protein [Chlamydiales bacterium]MCH9634995.1 hypothetical protein [Chlamydiales bacterium]
MNLEKSAIWTAVAILLLFSTAIAVTLITPHYVDPSWTQPSSSYQVQMYEVSDPNVYVSTSNPGGVGLQYVYHLQEGKTLQAYQESEAVTIETTPELESFVTRKEDKELKLTSRVLLLKKKEGSEVLELFDPKSTEAFAIVQSDGVVEPWASENFQINGTVPYDTSEGVLYVNNPKEYRVSKRFVRGDHYWLYDEMGEPIKNLKELKKGKQRFLSRKSLITMGENIFRAEGCWYCHTDQTRTLVQDVVLNGSADYPAPPSSANEYVYQEVTFPGTRRIGPDLSRVGIKRPHRDWHMSHFWSPKSESRGSIMPSYGHFFDNDPRGSAENPFGVPNYKFEAIFQYLMTKGTRITPPTQAWWLGKDPVQTIKILDEK